MSPPRIGLVTAGHASTCPRMRKVADALADAGYAVRWVSVQRDPEWARLDEEIFRACRWRPDPVRGLGARALPARVLGRLASARARRRFARGAAGRGALRVLGRAQEEGFDLLRRRVLREPADLVYGGTATGLAPAAAAARTLGVPLGLDFEDLYSGNVAPGPTGDAEPALTEALERTAAPLAAFRTASSPEIARAYEEALGLPFVAVCNTFPLADPPPQPERRRAGPLRLLWFSQTLGGDRGLEDAVAAAGLVRVPLRLLLVGRPVAGYLEGLRDRARREAPVLTISHEPPVPPRRLAELAREADVGLCLEPRTPRNRDLCLSNKALFLLAHGVPIACTATRAQQALAADVGEGAFAYEPGDVRALAAHLEALAGSADRLLAARRAAWDAAVRRWNWDDAREKGAVLDLVRGVVGGA